ncbi:hypothetical protein [Castellaniella sp.]|uniref:hypothetical protein n=1 Tax=Castellaniella sp. TaxID=1955812 RepID=UPI002AFEBEDE|nr:hypothetical protein [Castellaniella sp.]
MSTDFPAIIFPEAGTLSLAFKRLLHCVSREETRHYLRGVNVAHEPGVVRLEATDSHRACQIRLSVEGVQPFPSFILSHKSAKALAGLKKGEWRRYAELSPTEAVLRGSRESMPLETIPGMGHSGEYVDLGRAIPQDRAQWAIVPTAPFTRAMGALVGFSNGGKQCTPVVRLVANGDTLELTARAGDFSTTLAVPLQDCAQRLKDGFETGFNGGHLLDWLGDAPGKTVSLGFGDHPGDPVRLDSGCVSESYAIMPMRV